MWNISFTTKQQGEINESGFETSNSENLDDVLNELDSMFDLVDVDEVEIKINKMVVVK